MEQLLNAHLSEKKEIRIGFIGAGQVNFGGGEGPWDHATRLEKLAHLFNITVVGICDIDVVRAEKILQHRLQTSTDKPYHHIWKTAKVFSNHEDLMQQSNPNLIMIGLPPAYHGSEKYDVEIACLKRGNDVFIEKPLGVVHPSQLTHFHSTLLSLSNARIVSVGYMFRYSRAIAKMKEVINANGGKIKAFFARYLCAYSTISKEFWWDINTSGGPIIEQATHFCDLARYLGGEVDLDSIQAVAIGDTEPLKALPENIRKFEESIDQSKRIPRVTSASWKFTNGAIGSLHHGALLHGVKYENELEIWGDGFRLVLRDPYALCELSIRTSHSEGEERITFADDDIYYNELLALLNAVQTRDQNLIGSSYDDAFKTYQLTWAIRKASEKQ